MIEADLADLARPDAQGESLERFPGRDAPVLIRFVRVGEHRLWGASYLILSPLLPRLLSGEWGI